ncbi:hypothetical protein [Falsiroseomonas sp.]|uniref:hypothetical protein n=1 Tax=Falsiroseomonas sp. TaxID=2870721 RepID=UPI00273524CC|nr:hypothetical protein [Falsiroseomonas sp.]MDP3417872.1 hypothetical protein [Falsiroseomonas sp.]
MKPRNLAPLILRAILAVAFSLACLGLALAGIALMLTPFGTVAPPAIAFVAAIMFGIGAWAALSLEP